MLGRSSSGFGVIVCHLGSGCSATAVQNGQPVATTMGFTPLEGLVMATRSGSIDPGILFYLMKEKRLTADELEQTLTHRSGLLGLSGVSGDIREVEKAAKSLNSRAQLALEIFVDHVRSAIGALAVCLDQLDAIVFTAGIGENSAYVRQQVCAGLRGLGVVLDPDRNQLLRPDEDIAASDSRVRLLVIHTREERQIALEVQRQLRASETR
jgi:acetate kinase